MSKEIFETEQGLRITIEHENMCVEDGVQLHTACISIEHTGDWSLLVCSEEQVIDTFELEVEYSQEMYPDYDNDYEEDDI